MGHILDDASRVKKAVSIPVIGVGRVHDPYMIDAAIDEGWVDAVAVGRQSIADPYFPNKLLAGHPEEVCPCVSCLQGCVGRLNDPDYLDINCLMNPFVSREHEWKIEEAGQKKKIVVIGAGAAGMQYAQIAAQRGHEVIIFEKNDRVGGQVLLAAMPPSKQAFCSADVYKRQEEGLILWKKEIIRFKEYLEDKFDIEITDEKVREATHTMNEVRKSMKRLSALMAYDPAPATGLDMFHVMYGSTFKFDKSVIPVSYTHLDVYKRQVNGGRNYNGPKVAKFLVG